MRGQTAGGISRRAAAKAGREPAGSARPKVAVVLLSGGLDSATAAAWAKKEGYELVTVAFDYGQRHKKEITRAAQVAKALGVRSHRVLKVPLGELGGSALTDDSIEVPNAPETSKIGATIPSTYVPARNTVFLALALAVAEVEAATAIVIGANALDYSGYPDCRPEFLDAFSKMANLATKSGVEDRSIEILAPLLELTKRDIILLALRLKAPLESTWSCYRGGAKPCSTCESCVLRAKGFDEAGIADPAGA